MSELVDWANSWFTAPSSPSTPTEDRAWIYAALVDQLTSGVNTRKDLKIVHNFFTYLLRGWNPITAWANPSCAEIPDHNGFFTEEYKSTVKALMDFEHKPTSSDIHALLAHFSRSVQTGLSKQTDYEEEQKTLMILGLWLINRKKKFVVPNDIFIVRACMDLYHRSKTKPWSNTRLEYLSGSGRVGYLRWLHVQLLRLISSDKSTEQALDEFVYLVLFACLIRACRMVAECRTDGCWHGEHLHATQDAHVKSMYKFLENYPLIVVEEERRSSRFLNFFGVKLKKH